MDSLEELERLAEEFSKENKAKIFSVTLNQFDDEVWISFTFYCESFDYISMKIIDDSYTNFVIGFFSQEYFLNDDKLLLLEIKKAKKYGLLNAYVKHLYFKKY